MNNRPRDREAHHLKAQRKRQGELGTMIGAILEAKQPPEVSEFINRDTYAEVLKILLRVLVNQFNEMPLHSLRDGGAFVVARVASDCRVINIHKWKKRTQFTLVDLEDYSHSIDATKRRRARIA